MTNQNPSTYPTLMRLTDGKWGARGIGEAPPLGVSIMARREDGALVDVACSESLDPPKPGMWLARVRRGGKPEGKVPAGGSLRKRSEGPPLTQPAHVHIPVPAQVTHEDATPTFKQLPNGSWGVRGFGPTPARGQRLDVRKKDGTVAEVVVLEVKECFRPSSGFGFQSRPWLVSVRAATVKVLVRGWPDAPARPPRRVFADWERKDLYRD